MSIPNLQSLPALEDGVIVDQIAQQVINFEQATQDEVVIEASHEEIQTMPEDDDSKDFGQTNNPDTEEKNLGND